MSHTDDQLFSRRLFLTRGVQLLSVAGTLPLFLDRSGRALAAEFAANPQGVGRSDRVLVVVQLAGGNDGLNTVIPFRNDDYHKARPRIGIPANSALKVTDDFAFHPSAPGLKKLFDDGHLAVIHSVGYPNPNRSHFRSTDIWATAEPERVGHTGWLGRYFDNCCAGADPGAAAKPADKNPKTGAAPDAAIALSNDPPQSLQGEHYLPIAFRSPDSLTYREANRNASVRTAFDKLNDVDADPMMNDEDHHLPEKKIVIPLGTRGSIDQPKEDADDFLQRTALNARVYAEQVRKSASAVRNKATYPQSRFAADLKLVAQLIASGLPTRVYYVSLGGFDTHSNQVGRHERLMTELSTGLAAFVEDLTGLGQLDRTTVMTFSEFGRRVTENGSQGTDHGEAAPLFVLGSSIHAGFHGQAPDLSPQNLHRGDVPFSTDFRRVYATVLHDWLKADDAKVLGRKFEMVKLFKNAVD
jgi:uncharacterized protein (DUF1501 family)